MDNRREHGWAIWNPEVGLYYGTISDARCCAILDHTAQVGQSWEVRRGYGDKAVKVTVEVHDERI